MNFETLGEDVLPVYEVIENPTRDFKRIIRPSHPDDSLRKLIPDEVAATVFRLKRKAEIEPVDILAIDDMNIPSMSKKYQTKHVKELANDLQGINLTSDEDYQKMILRDEQREEDTKRFLDSIMFFDEKQNTTKLVLKRIEPDRIFELENDEESFRKNYRALYNEVNAKRKRDTKLTEKRMKLVEEVEKERQAGGEAQPTFKVYDLQLKEEFKQNVLYCNDQPMVVTQLFEIATNKEEEEAKGRRSGPEDDSYDYYILKRAPYSEATGGPKVLTHVSARNIFTSHMADDQELVHENDKDSEEAMNEDDSDSNDENHRANEYPEEEGDDEKDSQYSEEYYKGSEDDDDDYKDEEEDEEEDEEDCMDKGYYQKRLKNKFFENVKDMSKYDDDDY